jgi:hypothetical protein
MPRIVAHAGELAPTDANCYNLCLRVQPERMEET